MCGRDGRGRKIVCGRDARAPGFLVGAAFLVVLLKGVVEGQGEARVHLLPQSGEGPAETLLEVLLSLAPVAAEALGGGNQLRLLGH